MTREAEAVAPADRYTDSYGTAPGHDGEGQDDQRGSGRGVGVDLALVPLALIRIKERLRSRMADGVTSTNSSSST